MEEMNPCLFSAVEKDIGHTPYTLAIDGFWHVQCTCGARGPIAGTEGCAIEAWNNGAARKNASIKDLLDDVASRHPDINVADDFVCPKMRTLAWISDWKREKEEPQIHEGCGGEILTNGKCTWCKKCNEHFCGCAAG